MSDTLPIVRTVRALRAAARDARARGATVALVPTMGALHEGHLSLLRAARAGAPDAFVVLSLFVNPTQFNDARDLAAYPRDEARDVALASGAGASLVFAPDVEEVYPPGFATVVDAGPIALPLEGAARGPVHFRGVATVVAKLLNMVQPDVAWFGQKDAQQTLVIRRMVRDLDLPVRIEIAPTVREPDGLAMSSRNVRLSPEARAQALGLVEALRAVEAALAAGTRDARALHACGMAALAARGITPQAVDYLAIADTESLAPLATVDRPALVAVAAHVGGVRLIDNVLVAPREHATRG